MRAPDDKTDQLAELVRGTEGLQPWRRVFHLAGGVALAAMIHRIGPGSTAALALLSAAVVVGLALDVARLGHPSVNLWFFRWFRTLASPREAGRVASSTWYVVGILLVRLLFPADVLVPSILVLSLADPAASVVGRLWGRRPLGKGTVEGSLIFWTVATAVLWSTGPLQALALGAGIALCEVLVPRLDDNVVIPLATAAGLVLLG